MANHNKPANGFKKSPQNLDEVKSNGQIERSKIVNNMYTIRTLWGASSINSNLVAGIEEEVQNGKYDNALKLFNAIKENEEQNINIKSDNLTKQVIIDEKAINKAISDINEL